MLEIEEGQIYTFDKGKTYQIINHIEDDNDVWYQIWQAKEIATEQNLWTTIYPNEIVFKDIDFISKDEFAEWFETCGKFVGNMNKEFGLNDNWNMVKKKEATKVWFKMTENVG